MGDNPGKIYQSKSEEFTGESEQINRKMNRISLIRVILFILAILSLILWLRDHPVLALPISLVSLLLFLVFLQKNSRLSDRKKMLAQLIRINEDELMALDWQYNGFEPGTEYVDDKHPNASDLDLFGDRSVFQYLNRACSAKGRDKLAEWLKANAEKREILRRQEAVEELSLLVDWRQEFLATGRLPKESREDFDSLIRWLAAEPSFSRKKFLQLAMRILPVLTILSLVAVFFGIPENVPVMFILLQLGVVGFYLRPVNMHHSQVSRKHNMLSNYSRLIRLFENRQFSSAKLQGLQEGLSSSGIRAGEQLQRLARLVIQFDRRLNMITAILLNGFLMWDLWSVTRLESWKKQNAAGMPGWFDALAEAESLNSLATFRFNNPGSSFPEPGGDILLEAASLGHPLIPGKDNIRNDIEIQAAGLFILITGSNMAGKSTFLRTVGVNLVLAGAGAPVIADRMRWEPVRILSSMRVRDSLSSRESTFYAELKRLRMIIDVLNSGEQAMVILDEILKGTNSKDKHFGSDMFIRQLLKENCSGLIATHDLELSKLEDEFPKKLLNYSFEVQITDQEFIFDYRLRRGSCSTMNATELMKKMGISV